MNGALIIIFLVAAFALFLGLRARRGKDMNLEQWTVGGRGFGALFVFLLMAGEIYTTFTFLGGSGFAYGKGAPAYYILAYGTLAYVISYWLLPPIWRYGREHHLISQPHYFASLRQPGAGDISGGGRRDRFGSLSGAAIQGPRHHRLGRFVWRHFLDCRHLDRCGDRHGLCHGLRRARVGLERRREGHPDPGDGGVPRPLSAASLLRRYRRHVPCHRCGETRLPDLPAEWTEPGVVPVHRAVGSARLLHVAAFLRLRL